MDIVIMNYPFKVHELARLARVDKATKAATQESIQYLRKHYAKVYPKGVQLAKPNWQDAVTLTDAKKNYKLRARELEHLDYKMSYMPFYRKYCTLYNKKDVMSMCYLHHGVTDPDLIPAKVNKAAEKREQQFDKVFEHIFDNEYIYEDIAELPACVEFFTNGGKGIKALQKKLQTWPEFEAAYAPFQDKLKPSAKFYFFGLYMIDPRIYEHQLSSAVEKVDRKLNIVATIKTVVGDLPITPNLEDQDLYVNTGELHYLQRCMRRYNLEQALKAYNVPLRNDSEMCKKYIKGEVNDLAEIVKIMRQMAFLHNHTRYAAIYKHRMNDAYREAKDFIRDVYGYIADEEEYMDILDELLNKPEVSKAAQKEALRHYIGQIPDCF